MEKFNSFINGSSALGHGAHEFYNDLLAPIFEFMKPLVDAAAGLQKLLELLPH